MTNTINNRQMVFILYLTLTSFTVVTLPKIMAEKAGVGGWITILLTAVIFGILAAVIARLNSAFSGRMLFDYSRELTGRAIAVILAVFYIIYFLIVSVYLCTSMAEILKSNFLYRTPPWAFWAAGIPVFGYMAYKGVPGVARMFELYGAFFFVVMALIHILMILQGDTYNIRPFFIASEADRYFAAIPDAIIAFLGIEVLTVMPFAKKSKKAPRVAFCVILGIGMVYVLVVESCIMMVGIHEIKFYNYSLIPAIRLIVLRHIGFLRRLDILYLTTGLSGVFAGISAVYLAVVEYASRLLPKAGRAVVVCVVGAVIFLLSWFASGISGFSRISGWVITYAGLAAAGVIPVVLWVIAKVKKRA